MLISAGNFEKIPLDTKNFFKSCEIIFLPLFSLLSKPNGFIQ